MPPGASDSSNGESARQPNIAPLRYDEDNPSPPPNDEQHPENDDTREKIEEKYHSSEPFKIGGKKLETNIPPRKNNPNPRSSLSSRPELACREPLSSQEWEVFLSADEECLLTSVRLESQGQERKLNLTNPRECFIPSLHGSLIVSYGDGQELRIPLFEEGTPLIFKLRKDWTGTGRRVSRFTKGYFVIIAPTTWERIGHESSEPAGCIDPAFQVNFWQVLTSSEDFGGFKEWKIPSSAPVIELIGMCVFDNSKEGDLFVGDVPVLKESPEITWVRVGEEAEAGWGANFKPREKSLPEVLGNRNGWFFLRAYNNDVKLIDSISFRYLRDLRQIRINGEEYTQDMILVPPPSGYPLTKIGFVGADETTLSPYLPQESICTVTPSNLLEIPPSSEADSIMCILESSEGSVNVKLNLPRIWWQIQSDHADPNQWCDTPLTMTRKEFRQHAKANAKIFLSSQQFQSVYAGIDEDLEQKYRQPEIPLKHFTDYRQIANELKVDACFNVKWNEEIFPVIHICADTALPSPSLPTPSPPPTPLNYRPLVRVRRSRCARCEWQDGKGFSLGELQEVGLTVSEARSRSIPFDSRRRSLHSINVVEIRRIIDVC